MHNNGNQKEYVEFSEFSMLIFTSEEDVHPKKEAEFSW